MNTLFRPLSRTAALRRAPLAIRHPAPAFPIPRPASLLPHGIQIRAVASSVSGRPGSQTLGHAALNVREEVGNSTSDLAKRIAGGNFTQDAVASKNNSFLGITSSVASEVPKPYLVFGLAGGLPYIGAAATTIYTAHQAGQAAKGILTNIDPGVAHTLLDQALSVQVTYGAVILSFLGALHWGMEFSGYGGHKGYSRLALGAAPVLFAWPTLLLDPVSALIAQWAGFTGLWLADSKVSTLGWTPKWYSQYRFYLSILVGTCIIGSLAGTSYYGPVAGHGLLSHDLDLIREARLNSQVDKTGKVGGDVEALPDESGEHYVRIKKKQVKEEEGEGEGEGDSGRDAQSESGKEGEEEK